MTITISMSATEKYQNISNNMATTWRNAIVVWHVTDHTNIWYANLCGFGLSMDWCSVITYLICWFDPVTSLWFKFKLYEYESKESDNTFLPAIYGNNDHSDDNAYSLPWFLWTVHNWHILKMMVKSNFEVTCHTELLLLHMSFKRKFINHPCNIMQWKIRSVLPQCHNKLRAHNAQALIFRLLIFGSQANCIFCGL